MPIFKREKKASYRFNDFFRILVDDMPSSSKFCREVPPLVEENVSFLLSISSGDIERTDVNCDGHGWVSSGYRNNAFRKNDGIYEKIGDKRETNPKPGSFCLVRKYYYNKQANDFRKLVTHIENHRGQVSNDIVLVHYFFTGDEHSIDRAKHGYAKKCDKPYCKTKPSVVRKVMSKCSQFSVAQSIGKVEAESGGFTGMLSPADLSNHQQIYDHKSREKNASHPKSKNGDDLDAVRHLGNTDLKYLIRYVRELPDPVIVLATDKQLSDMDKFLCSDVDFSVMTVDPTFKLGQFNVTPISFRNLFLSTDPEVYRPPVVLGPLLIHYNKRADVYQSFLQRLVRLHPQLAKIKAYGTDGEKNLCDLLKTVFPNGCFRHFEDNVKSAIKRNGLEKYTDKVLDDFFNPKTGLTESSTPDEFQTRIGELSYDWLVKDPSGGFLDFTLERANMMKQNMIGRVRTGAGLGFPPAKYYSNDAGSMNF
jgi:hypothetical protein